MAATNLPLSIALVGPSACVGPAWGTIITQTVFVLLPGRGGRPPSTSSPEFEHRRTPPPATPRHRTARHSDERSDRLAARRLSTTMESRSRGRPRRSSERWCTRPPAPRTGSGVGVCRPLRKARLLAGDPAVTAMIGKRQLALPLSHDLPIHRARHPDYSLNLGRIAAALDEVRGGAPIVDIGANVGDSVAIIRDCVPDAPILCIEGDAQFLPYLRHNVRDLVGVEVAPVYVRHTDDGSRPVAVVRSGGTAQLVDQQGATHADPVTTRALDAILSDHPALRDAGHDQARHGRS